MSAQIGLEWTAGDGWLVLIGRADSSDELRAKTLYRMGLDRGVAYLGLNETAADAALVDLADLGAPTGYLVNILTEDDDSIRSLLRDVGLVVLDSHEDPRRMLDSLRGVAEEALHEAYQYGALVMAEGNMAALFGACWLSENGGLHEGLGWVADTLVLPGIGDQSEVRDIALPVFDRRPRTVALGIAEESALALGPGGTLEVWGDQPVALTLGPGFARPSDQSPQ